MWSFQGAESSITHTPILLYSSFNPLLPSLGYTHTKYMEKVQTNKSGRAGLLMHSSAKLITALHTGSHSGKALVTLFLHRNAIMVHHCSWRVPPPSTGALSWASRLTNRAACRGLSNSRPARNTRTYEHTGLFTPFSSYKYKHKRHRH